MPTPAELHPTSCLAYKIGHAHDAIERIERWPKTSHQAIVLALGHVRKATDRATIDFEAYCLGIETMKTSDTSIYRAHIPKGFTWKVTGLFTTKGSKRVAN